MATISAPDASFEVTSPLNLLLDMTLAEPWQVVTDNGYQAAVISTRTIGVASVG